MDLLDDMLDQVRARGAAFCRSETEPPWTMACHTGAPLVLGAMLEGRGWVTRGGGPPVEVGPGDIALFRGEGPIIAGDLPGAGAGAFVSAEYAMRGDVCECLLEALPELAVVPREPEFEPLLALMAAEAAGSEPGRQVVLDRMLDLLLVRALRSWFARAEAEPPAGYRALDDPRIGRALRALHERPARPWTVASLAAEAGLSRAAFARRFTALVGRPPLAYLTEWRMVLAADLLRAPGASVAAVARKVGYSDGFAFSNAFKRVRGVAPSEVLRSARAVDGLGGGGPVEQVLDDRAELGGVPAGALVGGGAVAERVHHADPPALGLEDPAGDPGGLGRAEPDDQG